jgi:hypothetical protein
VSGHRAANASDAAAFSSHGWRAQARPAEHHVFRVWAGTPVIATAPDFDRFARMVVGLARTPAITRLTVNFFDGNASACPAAPNVDCSAIVGMKGLFWKTVFTPAATAKHVAAPRSAAHVATRERAPRPGSRAPRVRVRN